MTVQVFEGKYACPDTAFFRLFFVDGIHRLLADESKDWAQFFGAIFGWYVYHVLSGFGIDSPVLTRTIYRSPKFQGTNDEVCDTLLLWSNTAVLFEAKGMRLTTRQESGISVADTLKAIDGMLGDKKSGTGQLAKSIQRILDGQVVVAENSVADIRACGTIIPAIVVYDESLGNHAVRNHLQARFAQQLSRSGAISDSIGPLLLLTTRDIELLERLALAHSAEDVIRDYSEAVRRFPNDPITIFHSYAITKYKIKNIALGWIDNKLNEVVKWIISEYASRQR